MIMLIAGLILFAGVHLSPALAPTIKVGAVNKLGDAGYQGIFSLLLLSAMALIVFGWRSTPAEFVYLPPEQLKLPALALVCIGFFAFLISKRPSRVKRLIRHPQLTGVICWAVAHLMLNGDNRSLLLFTGFALWALLDIIAINRRDGVWIKEESPALRTELISVVITVVVVALLVVAHPYLSGVAVR